MTFKENGVYPLYNKENAEKLKRGKNGGALIQEAKKNPRFHRKRLPKMLTARLILAP